ncbi:MAG: AbrB/MazE/SpoVT family DNA-binding domain-containing protein [Acutalibacteraceae bacterium]
MNKNDNFIATVKIGPKGQIVIPKEVREMFGLESGDSLVLLADKSRGIALQRAECLNEIVHQIVEKRR